MSRMRVAAVAILAILLGGAGPAEPRVAVLSFAAQPVGMNDEILADRAQLNELESAFLSALRARGVDAVPVRKSCSAADDACFASAERSVHAQAVVSGAVTRYMALFWDLDISVRGNAARGSLYHNPFKGDYDALLHAMPDIAAEVKRSML